MPFPRYDFYSRTGFLGKEALGEDKHGQAN